MQQARSAPNKALWSAAIATALVIALVVFAGCTMVGDDLTGMRVHRADVNSCVKDCNDQYKDLYSQEQALHLSNVDACQLLDQPDKDTCLSTEDARHAAAMEALGEAKAECQNNCHRQGGGSAG